METEKALTDNEQGFRKNTEIIFARERKLEAIDYYHEKGRNTGRTATEFGVDCKQIRSWFSHEASIRKQKPDQHSTYGSAAHFPAMEQHLYDEFVEM